MDKLGKLDLAGTFALGMVAAGLLAGWIATSAQAAARHERTFAREAVTLTADGRMKVTVTAKAEGAGTTRQVNTAATRPSSGPTISAIGLVLPGT